VDLWCCFGQSEHWIRPFGTSTIIQVFRCQSNKQALSMLESHCSLGPPRASKPDNYLNPIQHNKDVADELVVLLLGGAAYLESFGAIAGC
jgi:hypothetical protein